VRGDRTLTLDDLLDASRRSPMYALCFAAGNPKGAQAAVRIASHLTRD
jgi:hypothetical protein